MNEIILIIFVVTVFGLIAVGYPVAFTIGGVSVIFGFFAFGLNFFYLLPMRIYGIMSNYVLIAVPLFIFMGVMLEKSGIAEELLETMAMLFGKLRGGLAISVLVVGTMLGASTGIVGATVVTMGILSLPVMLRRNYDAKISTGIIMASGTLGQIIPPSIVLVLLGSVLNVSVGNLFVAAVIPGFILVALYFIYLLGYALVNKNLMPAMPKEELEKFSSEGKSNKILTAFVFPFMLIIAVLGSIFAGIASPTEAAAVGAMGAIFLTIIKKKFSKENLESTMLTTLKLTSMAFMILVGASAFGLVFRGLHGDKLLTDFILSSNMEPHHFLVMVMVLVFIAGFFIDFIEITFIIVPIVAPIFIHLNIDLLWVGILIALNLQTSFLTPPFGFSIFYLKGVAPNSVRTVDLYKGAVPFVIIQLLVVVLVIIFPSIATTLPDLIGK